MKVRRGDVVLIDFPFPSGGGAKVRPALVVQNDRDNQRLVNTIVIQITSITRRALEPTQLAVPLSSPAGIQGGLRQDSVVNCVNIATLHENTILHLLGSFPPATMQEVNARLKAALGLG